MSLSEERDKTVLRACYELNGEPPNKVAQCLCLRKDSTVQHHNAVSMKHKGRESNMEGGLTNGFAVKETN